MWGSEAETDDRETRGISWTLLAFSSRKKHECCDREQDAEVRDDASGETQASASRAVSTMLYLMKQAQRKIEEKARSFTECLRKANRRGRQ